ncbi:hypothetical protein HK098_000459 [Nowakowskiella sp. JEL0407]|nr:hypothetical protein HK098_000459 [Nowakowskiella sp. JEL0407]
MSEFKIPETQSAYGFKKYGLAKDVIEKLTVPVPKLEPNSDQILVKIHAACYNKADMHKMHGVLKNFTKLPIPSIPGADFSGVVVAKGSLVTKFGVGDEVYGTLKLEMNLSTMGTSAEYTLVSTKKDYVELKPSLLSHEEAAATGIASMTAASVFVTHLNLPKEGKNALQGKKLLVVGASGGVGSYVVLVAKYYGAEVTGVCSAKNVKFVKETLKADNVIDYTSSPLENQFSTASEFDLIVDCVGGDDLWHLAQKILNPKGSYLTVVGPMKELGAITIPAIFGMVGSVFYKKLFYTRKYILIQDIATFGIVHEWVSSGASKPPVVEVFEFDDSKKALELMDTNRAVGKVVVKVC